MISIHDQARSIAKSCNIAPIAFEGGFYLFDATDGEQLGHPDFIHLPWTSREVIDFCCILQEGAASGVYRV